MISMEEFVRIMATEEIKLLTSTDLNGMSLTVRSTTPPPFDAICIVSLFLSPRSLERSLLKMGSISGLIWRTNVISKITIPGGDFDPLCILPDLTGRSFFGFNLSHDPNQRFNSIERYSFRPSSLRLNIGPLPSATRDYTSLLLTRERSGSMTRS
jgi:hypothetical protein